MLEDEMEQAEEEIMPVTQEEEEEEEEEMMDDLTNNTSNDPLLSQPYIPKKIKKPSSSWIIFCGEKREELRKANPEFSFKETAAALSASFKNLSQEERALYEEKAKEQKERYATELAEQERLIALYGNQEDTTTSQPHKKLKLTTEPIFPLARIKRIMKMDQDVKNIKPEAAVAVGKALELFIAFMAVRAGQVAARRKRRTVKRSDVVELIHLNEVIGFLRKDFPQETKKISSDREKSVAKSSKLASSQTATVKATAGSSKITSFFEKSTQSGSTTNSRTNNVTDEDKESNTVDNDDIMVVDE